MYCLTFNLNITDGEYIPLLLFHKESMDRHCKIQQVKERFCARKSVNLIFRDDTVTSILVSMLVPNIIFIISVAILVYWYAVEITSLFYK